MSTGAWIALGVFIIVLILLIGGGIYYYVEYDSHWTQDGGQDNGGGGGGGGGGGAGPGPGPVGSFAFESVAFPGSYIGVDPAGNVVGAESGSGNILFFTSSTGDKATIYTVAGGAPNQYIGYILGGLAAGNKVVIQPQSTLDSNNHSYQWDYSGTGHLTARGGKAAKWRIAMPTSASVTLQTITAADAQRWDLVAPTTS